MWTTWLRAATGTGDSGAGGAVMLTDPVEPTVLAEVEDQLGVRLPEELRSLLVETDGIADDEGAEPVWPAERIAEENAARWDPSDDPSGEPPDLLPEAAAALLFFGDTGTEDLFAYRVDEAGEVTAPDVYLWLADRGLATWVAADLQSMLDDWFSSEPDG